MLCAKRGDKNMQGVEKGNCMGQKEIKKVIKGR